MAYHKNILLVANYSNSTGYAWSNIYRLFDAIIDEFSEEDRHVFVTFAKLEKPVMQLRKGESVCLEEWDPFDRSIRNSLRLCRILRKFGIGCVYLTDLDYCDWRYLLFRIAGVKKIVVHSRVSVADPTPAEYESGMRGGLKHCIARIRPVCADRVFAVSSFVRNRFLLKNRAPASKIKTILNGIDVDEFKKQQQKQSQAVIFCSGRASLHKGIHVLLKATRYLLDFCPNCNFQVRYAGDGPDFERFKALARELDVEHVFEFLGQLATIKEEIKRASIVVVPSIWGDACPSAVSEGLAAGHPVVATAAGGIPEMIGGHMNALLVPAGDAEALFCALYTLLNSDELRKVISKNGRERAERALSQDRYHREVIEQLRIEFNLV